jgi:simple sugar transport system permease protein
MRFRWEKRTKPSLAIRVMNPILFIVLAMAFCAIFISTAGFDPVKVYAKMIKTAFFTEKGLTQTVLYSIPLMLCGLGVSISFRMNLNNLGAEGQYAIGAIVSGGFALFGPAMPTLLKLILAIILGLVSGSLWAILAALPKASGRQRDDHLPYDELCRPGCCLTSCAAGPGRTTRG